MSDKAKEADAKLQANVGSEPGTGSVVDEAGEKKRSKSLRAPLSKSSEIVCTPEHQAVGSTSSPSATGPLHSPSCASSLGADVASSEVGPRKDTVEKKERGWASHCLTFSGRLPKLKIVFGGVGVRNFFCHCMFV